MASDNHQGFLFPFDLDYGQWTWDVQYGLEIKHQNKFKLQQNDVFWESLGYGSNPENP